MWSSSAIGTTAFLCGFGTGVGIHAVRTYLHRRAFKKIQKVIEAAHFSAEKHRDQRRESVTSEPFVNHYIRVAKILADHGVDDSDVLLAGMLLGWVTDSNTSLDEVTGKFGPRVGGILNELREDHSVPAHLLPQRMLARAAKLSWEARVVLLAHKLDWMLDILRTPVSESNMVKIENYARWAEQVAVSVQGTHAGLEKELRDVFRLLRSRVVLPIKKVAESGDSGESGGSGESEEDGESSSAYAA